MVNPTSPITQLQTHWSLSRMPFTKNIPIQALSAHPSHLEAVARIGWVAAQRQIGLIAGEVGAGKTVAVRAALATLEPARHLPIYVPDPTIGPRGIYTQVVEALGGTPHRWTTTVQRRASDLLAGELDERGRVPVLIIDEAHLLSNQALDALRMLTNSDMDATATFCLLLVGQPTLRRKLKMAVLTALDQRIATRYTITPMNPEETTGYINAHLAWAGRTDTLFTSDAINQLHHASRGYPRAVNVLATAAMIAAYTTTKPIIDLECVDTAITETNQ